MAAQAAYKGMGMEGPVAWWYARNTGKSLDDFKRSAALVAAHLRPDASVLEVAPGPGYLAIELARLGTYRIVGLDISESFVRMARAKAHQAGANIEFRLGDAAEMPFDAASFDFVVCRAAFKNFARPVEALQQMHRVLKPGGSALVLDLRRDVTDESIAAEVEKMGMNAVNRMLTRWIFKHMLRKRAYTRADIESFVAKTTFGRCDIEDDGVGFAVWLRK